MIKRASLYMRRKYKRTILLLVLLFVLAFSLAAGCEWQGRGCAKSRVLLIDNELHKETLGCRLAKVARAMGISPDDEILDNLTVFPQRGGKKTCGS